MGRERDHARASAALGFRGAESLWGSARGRNFIASGFACSPRLSAGRASSPCTESGLARDFPAAGARSGPRTAAGRCQHAAGRAGPDHDRVSPSAQADDGWVFPGPVRRAPRIPGSLCPRGRPGRHAGPLTASSTPKSHPLFGPRFEQQIRRTAAYQTPPFLLSLVTRSAHRLFRRLIRNSKGDAFHAFEHVLLPDRSTQKRSRVITLVHASTKSRTNFSCASSAA